MYHLKPSFPILNIHQSHSAEDETASLFISRGGVLARSCYAHINDEDNSLGVISNLLTRSLCRPFSHFDADDGDVLSVNPLERRDQTLAHSLHQPKNPCLI